LLCADSSPDPISLFFHFVPNAWRARHEIYLCFPFDYHNIHQNNLQFKIFISQNIVSSPLTLGPLTLGPLTLGPLTLGPLTLGPLTLGPLCFHL
jgi:hypothetical protein